MTIDYCENRLDGILEAGEWLMDRAVEGAIARNDWAPPARKEMFPHSIVSNPRYLEEQAMRNAFFDNAYAKIQMGSMHDPAYEARARQMAQQRGPGYISGGFAGAMVGAAGVFW